MRHPSRADDPKGNKNIKYIHICEETERVSRKRPRQRQREGKFRDDEFRESETKRESLESRRSEIEEVF